MTLCRTLLQLTALGSFLILAGVTPAQAEEASEAKRCPPVYGTWRTTHTVDNHFRTQPISESADTSNLIKEVRIDKGHIEAIWFNGKKREMSSEWYEYNNSEAELCTDKSRLTIHVNDNNYMIEVIYFSQKGHLDTFFHNKIDGVYYEDHHVRMKRLR